MSRDSNAAVYYAPEAFGTAGQKLMGRNVAGETFLRAFAKHADVDALYCFGRLKEHFDHFRANVTAAGRGPSRLVWIAQKDVGQLGQVGCLFYPSPGIAEMAWQRRHFDARSFSICGMTYTISTNRVMDAVSELLTAPVQPWDALVCISTSVKRALSNVLEDWADYLKMRIGGTPSLPIQMPVIPLGVDCDQHADFRADPVERARYRRELGIGEDDIAVLFLGRLSFHAKANPIPMYIALEAAQQRVAKRVHLILAGRFSNKPIEEAFRSGAKALCPSVGLSIIEGTRQDCKRAAFAAADIFTSLSDNIQESFGLAPLEAMAAGLPVVVSDWNGYREIVRDGIDGVTVPTVMPAGGAGEELARRYDLGDDDYDHYIGHVSLSTAVDIAACTDAYAALMNDAGLARAMGEAGRRRARETFDWPVIIGAYQELWADLAQRRVREGEIVPAVSGQNRNPLRPDPFGTFAAHASFCLGAGLAVSRSEGGPGFDFFRNHDLANLSFKSGLSEQPCIAILRQLSDRSPRDLAEILAEFPSAGDKAAAQRILAWLLKSGQVRLAPPAGQAT